MNDDLLFIETMRIVAGAIANFERHLSRMRSTVNEVFGCEPNLAELQQAVLPADARKCRVVYGRQIQSIEFADYRPRTVNTLKLVEASAGLDYHLKYADRSALNALRELRGDCDEILIVRDGHVTDTSYTNVVFTDGEHYVTPDTCLLPGTMRASLLHAGAITAAPVTVDDIRRYTHVALINAMLPLHALPLIPVSALRASKE